MYSAQSHTPFDFTNYSQVYVGFWLGYKLKMIKY